MLIADKWEDYKLIKTSHGEKIELWGNYLLRRPDPQIIWDNDNFNSEKYDAIYHRSNQGGGYWENVRKFPEFWTINYKDLKFKVSPTGFKHTGLFPEQAANPYLAIVKFPNIVASPVVAIVIYSIRVVVLPPVPPPNTPLSPLLQAAKAYLPTVKFPNVIAFPVVAIVT